KKIVAGLENSASCESAFARRQVEDNLWQSFQNERHQTISAQVSIRVMYCTLDVRYFPFDTQECNMTFVSWTYDGFQVALNHTGQARPEGEWKVTGITPYQQFNKYPCCESPFPVIHFTIHMYRRCLFYVINLICPCLLIYFVSFLAFYLPIESGEKVNLEITVLLALVVFLLMVSETMPPTPDAIPILGLLFTVTMTMVALGVVMAVIVTQVFFLPAAGAPAGLRHAPLPPLPSLDPPEAADAATAAARLRAQKGIARMRAALMWTPSASTPSRSAPVAVASPRQRLSAIRKQRPRRLHRWRSAPLAGQWWRRRGRAISGPDHDIDRLLGGLEVRRLRLDRIFFWTFSLLTACMFLVVCWVAYPAFFEDHSLLSGLPLGRRADEHRPVGVVQHVVAHGAQEGAPQGAEAAAAHHHQVRLVLLGRLHDGLARLAGHIHEGELLDAQLASFQRCLSRSASASCSSISSVCRFKKVVADAQRHRLAGRLHGVDKQQDVRGLAHLLQCGELSTASSTTFMDFSAAPAVSAAGLGHGGALRPLQAEQLSSAIGTLI
uniref:Neur_chan_LBD domain-containing protein n=1 Tax=Macrostomum lignano TaxID=282301 RepID=A0A1I8FJV6_9PLAT